MSPQSRHHARLSASLINEEMPAAPLLSEGSPEALKAFKQRDWGGILTPTGGCVSGWRTLEPSRYALLSLTLLGVGALYQQLLPAFMGLGVTVWATRRAQLNVSPKGELALRCSALGVTYRVLRLPLWTPIRRLNHHPLATLWLGDSQSSALPFELFVSRQERAEDCERLLREALRRAQASRLAHPQPPHRHSAGEWAVSLIKVLPLLQPSARHQTSRSAMSWWAPSGPLWVWGFICLMLTPVSLCLNPSATWPLALCLALAVFPLLFSWERLDVSAGRVTWSRQLMGVTRLKRSWVNPHMSLLSDTLSPDGRCVMLYEPQQPQSLHYIGHTWDSDWLWRQLSEARQHHPPL